MNSLPAVFRSTTAALALSVALFGAMGGAIAQAATLKVRPLITRAAWQQARSRGLVPRASVMTPEEERLNQQRIAHMRAFQPMEKLLQGPDALRHAGERPARFGPTATSLARAGLEPHAILGAAEPETIRMAILRIDFLNDRGGSASTGDGRFDLTPPDTNAVPLDRAPHNRTFYMKHGEALKRYYEAMSYGRTVVECEVWPSEEDSAYHMNDLADLGPWTFGQGIYDAAVHMTRSMFFAADSQSTLLGDRIPWDRYQKFTIIHAGGDLQSDVRQDSKEDIPSFTIFLTDTLRVEFPDSTSAPIDRVSFVPETINQDGYYGTINGVLAHENGHNIFGFADIYDVSTGQTTVGYWTLMDSGNLLGTQVQLNDGSVIYATGLLPPSTDPFQRQFTTDALQLREPFWGDTMSIAGNERSPIMYYVPLSTDEYLLLENRYISPTDLVELDQDSTTRVILGPKSPDRYEYDALMPGGGIVVWKIDESVITFDTSLRINEDYGWNSNPFRHGVDVIEADGLDDLGDGGSPYALGSDLDPFQMSVNPVLSDTTQPNLIPNQGTRPHIRIDFVSDADSIMRFVATRTWTRDGWPVRTEFPRGGPQLLAIDADGDQSLEVCWAGGNPAGSDSAGLFAVKPNGQPLATAASNFVFATLDRRPLPLMAATATGNPATGLGPAVFAAVTAWDGTPADTAGGKVWLVDAQGQPLPGWPVRLPSPATTPPMLVGEWPGVLVYVGCNDGTVRELTTDGVIQWTSVAMPGPLSGRLAFWQTGLGAPGPRVCPDAASGARPASAAGVAQVPRGLIACGDSLGNVAVLGDCGFVSTPPVQLAGTSLWPVRLGGNGFQPDFLWLRLGGEGTNADPICATQPTLVTHSLDRLWAHCATGEVLPGWGQPFGDTLVAGLGAGDPDGDGFPEVLVQTQRSQVAFVNRSGRPTPGWPKAGSRERFLTSSPPVTADLDADGRGDVIALNASGVIAVLNDAGRTPAGFPLATGSGCSGSMVIADLDRDGLLDLAAPDRFGQLYQYSPPLPAAATPTALWPMVGGDPARTSALPALRTPAPPAAAIGPLERNTLKAYPNPARNKPVSFAYRLSEEADVEYRIVDASGHQVAAFSRRGQRADNVDTWDPGALPAGLYVARLRFRSARGDVVQSVPLGLLR